MAQLVGRKVSHDPRSLDYPAARAGSVQSILWPHRARVLDQKFLGSCTGMALAQVINTDKFSKARGASRLSRRYLHEMHAVDLYALATTLDGFPGRYPPTDTGSSGLAVAKAGVRAGYLSGYRHAFGFGHFLYTIQLQPVITGTMWYESMYYPDRRGHLEVTGKPVGGHEYAVLGVDMSARKVLCLNSWGAAWGNNGRFTLSFNDFELLLEDNGDVTVPISI